jgi:hypothetical protein
MMHNYENSDVKIHDIKITNATNTDTKDVRAQLISLSIYEDMQEPTIFAELILDDQIALVQKLPIVGEETITISFKSPFRDQVTTYNLKVFSISGEAIQGSNKGSVYKLQCVSEEHFVGSVMNIEKAYKDTVGNIIKDIMINNLKTKKPIDIETTKGMIPYVIPRMNPFQAIDLLRQRAVGQVATGGVFVFYENQSGFHFRSIESLVEMGKSSIDSRIFKYSPATKEDLDRQTHNFRNMLNYEHLKKTDTITKLSAGLFNNITKSYDIHTKAFEGTTFKLAEQHNKIVSGQQKSTLPNSIDFTNDYSNRDQYKFFTPKDTSKGVDYIPEYFGYKQAFATLFNQNIVRAFVHGDSYLRVGDMVKLELPESSAIKTTDKKDKMYSGNYVITKLRHLIHIEDGRFKHRVSFDCNKIGFLS